MDSLTTVGECGDDDFCRISKDFEILRRTDLFKGINHEVIKLFAYLSPRQTFKKGNVIIEQGKNANQAFVIVNGTVEIYVHHGGHDVLLKILEEGDIFGELSLLARFRWFLNAKAKADTETITINRTTFQKVLEKYPEHKDKIIERAVQLRVNRLAEQTNEILDRVASHDFFPEKRQSHV